MHALWMWLVLSAPAVGAPPPADTVDLFVRPNCDACRLQQRVLAAMQVRPRVLDVSTPEAQAAFERAAHLVGAAPDPVRLPTVVVNGAVLMGDPAWPEVRAHLTVKPPAWRVPRSGLRVQLFSPTGSAGCPQITDALEADGVRVERADAGTPAVAERMWLTLRLLGHDPRRGVGLPLLLIDDRPVEGCPTLGDLAAALDQPALRDQARAVLLADASAPTEVLRALNAARALPHAFLTRLGHVGAASPSIVDRLAMAQSQPVFRLDPALSAAPVTWRVVDPLSPHDAIRRLVETLDAHGLDLLLGPHGGRVWVVVEANPLQQPVVSITLEPGVAADQDRIDGRPMRR